MISDDCSLPAGTIAPHLHPIPMTDSTVSWHPHLFFFILLLFLICHFSFLLCMNSSLLPEFWKLCSRTRSRFRARQLNLTLIVGTRLSPRKTKIAATCIYFSFWKSEDVIFVASSWEERKREQRWNRGRLDLVRASVLGNRQQNLRRRPHRWRMFLSDESTMWNVFFMLSRKQRLFFSDSHFPFICAGLW